MSEIGQRYRKGELRYWDALVEIATKYGISRDLYPEKWSYGAEIFVYALIGQRCQRGRRWPNARLPTDPSKLNKFLIDGRAAVARELAPPPAKPGRPKGAINRNLRKDVDQETVHKRKQRGYLWSTDLTDEEFDRRFQLDRRVQQWIRSRSVKKL
jgi:hypothetical protein